MLLFPFLWSVPTHKDFIEEFYIWNVGQGSWSTYSMSNKCIHFDMGGEFAPWKKILRMCSDKQNILLLSHADKDHLSFAAKFNRHLKNLCLQERPQGFSKSKTSARILSSLPICKNLKELNFLKELKFKVPLKFKNSNDRSRIYELKSEVLFPGDSTARAEKLWSKYASPNLRVLLLGHHGSKTSSSIQLLSFLSQLKMAIASARKKMYGHPHAEVQMRLKSNGISLLKTEDWGSIKLDVNKAK